MPSETGGRDLQDTEWRSNTEGSATSGLLFAATIVAEDLDKKEIDKKTSVTKSIDDNGLITTDGELMAALSEEEDWELKDLMDVFEDEIADSKGTSTLADRDVAASILNMRMNMHNEDYRKVFDKRNFFIGEDN